MGDESALEESGEASQKEE
jgi:hypothetical protein